VCNKAGQRVAEGWREEKGSGQRELPQQNVSQDTERAGNGTPVRLEGGYVKQQERIKESCVTGPVLTKHLQHEPLRDGYFRLTKGKPLRFVAGGGRAAIRPENAGGKPPRSCPKRLKRERLPSDACARCLSRKGPETGGKDPLGVRRWTTI